MEISTNQRFAQVKLTPWQETVERAYNEGAKYVLIKAGRKAGKSVYARHRLVRSCMQEPTVSDQTNAYIAPSRVQAKKIMWRPMQTYICPRGNWQDLLAKKPHETELWMDFKSGIRLGMEGADNDTTIRGWNMGETVIDEADHIKNNSFFSEVVEPNFLITKPNVLMISSPANRWFTKLWRRAKNGELGRSWAAFHFTSFDNPYVDKAYVEEKRESMPHHIWEQEYMANEYAMSGLKYTEFDRKMIVEHRAPVGERLLRFIDWGWDHPSACLWADLFFNTDTQRWNLYIFREFSVRGKDLEELSLAIRAGDDRKYIANIIDKSAKRTEIGTGKPIREEFARHGLPCLLPPNKKDYHVNSLKMMFRRGDIQISKECRELIRQVEEVEWDTQRGDDMIDALEYGAAYVYNKDFHNITAAMNQPEPEKYIAPGGLLDQSSSGSWGGLEVVNY